MNVSEIIEQFTSSITAMDVILLAGILLLCNWLVKTSLGRKALADSMPRRNNMPAFMPFIPLFIWFGILSVAMSAKEGLLGDLPNWKAAFADNLILCISAIIGMVIIIFFARSHFPRRLKGFGLNIKTIHKDFIFAFLNLLAVWPILILMIMLTIFVGQFIWGPQFRLPQHEELELIAAYPQLPVRVLIIITTIVVMPVFEEMLFRGMFQTMIRTFLSDFEFRISNFRCRQSAWLAITISSGIFATVHANAGHWPAIFALAVCLGYSYEKSGSLFRPIFIHCLFNATSVLSVLSQ
jgi:membrane protease YdiL (CAAX protease family)